MKEELPASASSDSHLCLECGKKTANPKFCNRSCAAKYNNRVTPKRSPEGTCQTCKTAISSNRTYCEICWKAREEERLRPKRSVSVSQESVFSIHGSSLFGECSVGDFLDDFEAVAKLSPCYLPPADWQRHADFLQLLRQFSTPHWRLRQSEEPISALEFPISELEWLLHNWVESVVFTNDAHPLAPTFALATAEVIAAHAHGEKDYEYYNEHRRFRIDPMVRELQPPRQEIAGQNLKKEITQRDLSNLMVAARLPEGVKITLFDQDVAFPSHDIFFVIAHCHRSQVSDDR